MQSESRLSLFFYLGKMYSLEFLEHIWVHNTSINIKLLHVKCCDGLYFLAVQDARNFGWELNERIDFNWKKLLEKKVGVRSLRCLALIVLQLFHIS